MALLGSPVVLGLLVAPLIYLFLRVLAYFRTIYYQGKAVLQWPGLPRQWFTGNITQHPLAHITEKNRHTAGTESMKWELEMVEKYPRGMYFFSSCLMPGFIANHPACAKGILKGGDPKPLSGPGYNLLLPWLGQGLLIATGKKWSRNRRLLTPSFHFEILKPYLAIYNDTTDTLLEKMRNHAESGNSFEVTKNLNLCTLDILLQCIFSQKSNCQIEGDKHPYVSTVKRVSIETMERMFVSNPLLQNNFIYLNLTSRGRKLKKEIDYMHQYAEDLISIRREQLKVEMEKGQKTDRKYLDFLDILLSARTEDGEGLTDLEVRNEVDTFLFAGHDTTASGLSWMLYTMAKHPEHQRKVQKELDETFAQKDNDHLEWDDLSKLSYLPLCIKESIRLYPPAIGISRQLENDTEVDGRILKAGTMVDIDIYAIHHHPDYWTNPEEFNPERFLPENSKNRDPFSYVPFSAGPRNCIGQNFAQHEMKVILGRILHNFDLELDPTHEVNFGLELVLKPANDIKVVLTKRRWFMEH